VSSTHIGSPNSSWPAVLKGDVNGSWQSQQETPQQLPASYFRDLSLELNTPVGQWGIGG